MKWRLPLTVLFAVLFATTTGAAEPSRESARVLIMVGPSNHPPGSHEVAAGGRLIKHCLENASNLKGVRAEVIYDWPRDASQLDSANTIVMIGDTFPLQRWPDTKVNLERLGERMKRGCGIVCVHYATGLRAEDVAPDGEHPLLHWMGGYFATRCNHHQSIAKIYPKAAITPSVPLHPVSRGWHEFVIHDEPYINNYFGPNGNKMAANVTALATSMLPPESPRRETVAWCVERPDRGRGFGIVMPHFYRSWRVDDLRKFILNGVIWSAGMEVPTAGVNSQLPDLTTFQPESVEPITKAP